jgi:hypothetical protein
VCQSTVTNCLLTSFGLRAIFCKNGFDRSPITAPPRLQLHFVIFFDTKKFAKTQFPATHVANLKNAGVKSAKITVSFLNRSFLHYLPQHIFRQAPEAHPRPTAFQTGFFYPHSPPAHLWPMSLRAHAFGHVSISAGYLADKDIFLKEVFKRFSYHETHTDDMIIFPIFKKMTGIQA